VVNGNVAMNYKIIGSTGIGSILLLVLVKLSFDMTTTPVETALNLAILVLGVACGWLLGILISPYSSAEHEEFSAYAKAFGVFASGYLVAKLDKVIEELFKPEFILDSVHDSVCDHLSLLVSGCFDGCWISKLSGFHRKTA